MTYVTFRNKQNIVVGRDMYGNLEKFVEEGTTTYVEIAERIANERYKDLLGKLSRVTIDCGDKVLFDDVIEIEKM